ncbi:MAG TPA: 2-oxo-4-hydroxy-4-carboxy-5-ureidoimidazoline decarboxylase [Streptosporangiaceae bacterium]|jgi:2-oxo-4-hydroxy-4-carboxy-5-ureidoimidazoline decarboxylase|nr:2-oxo-4-hydroxy-4-carboxy-5-ureidoimidazoline decarboxylase [Streptosporangiaceae bacterium]
MGTNQLTWFNQLTARAAQQTLLDCCSARAWAEPMAAGRPYASAEDAIRRSGAIVAELSVADLAEALAGHPRIGERPDTNHGSANHGSASQEGASQEGAGAADWSRQEQSGVDAGDTATKRALAEANLEYEQRFGHIYLVCASGRTGTELLALLRGRLQNEPEDEWQVVRTELQKINALRLHRLLAGVA